MMGADGAFTWEMVLRPDEAFDSGTGTQLLMLPSSNQMQLKLLYAATGYLYLDMWDGVNSATLFTERLDAGLGVNTYATNEWFHLAVTYDGTSTGKVYWTKLGDDDTGTANELGSFSMSDLLLDDATLAFDSTDDIHDFRLVGFRTSFINDDEICIIKSLCQRSGANNAANIG